jgi:hypothetical protein
LYIPEEVGQTGGATVIGTRPIDNGYFKSRCRLRLPNHGDMHTVERAIAVGVKLGLYPQLLANPGIGI